MNHLRYLSIIEKNDSEVSCTIRTTHAHEFMVADAALDQILLGLNDFGSLKERPDSRLESARFFLATRSFNSLLIARQALERGYYQQALTLVRMAMEDQLVADDAENHSPTLIALLEGEGKIGRGDLALQRMAERVSPKAREVWDSDYGTLSERAAHPRLKSMRMLVFECGGNATLQPGSRYEEVEVREVFYYLLREIEQVMTTTCKLTIQVGSDWSTQALPVFNRVDSLWKQIDEWAANQLGETLE